jgi:hypothetical protein
VEVAFHRPILFPQDIVIDGNIIYTANGPEGVFAFWFAPPAVVVAMAAMTTTLASPFDTTSYIFPAGTFSDTVVVTHTAQMADAMPAFGMLEDVGHDFVVTAVYSNTGQPAEVVPNQTYTITIQYSDAQRTSVIEDSLTLSRWDGQAWQAEPNSVVDVLNNTVTAAPAQFGQFAILGETHRLFFPIITSN